MKFTREITNGFIIFLGIGIYFLILELLGLSDVFYLRILNAFFVAYGVNRTLSSNHGDGILGYNRNFLSAVITSMVGAVLSVATLFIYIQYQGGEAYMKSLANNFVFGGGELTVNQYIIGLLFESVAASFIVSFTMMQYWKGKMETINKID